MAFLFKSKKSHGQDRALASRDGNSGSQGSIQSAGGRVARDEKGGLHHRATPTGSVNSIENEGSIGSPEQGHARRGGSLDQIQAQASSDLPLRNGPPVSNSNASLYPWSQRRLAYTSSHPCPFPRYGAAVNSVSSKEGDIYMMGGLINSSNVKGDLWLVEAGGNMTCYPLATTAEGPGPRVGHSSLLVGNAFIVYGGDTKIDESDMLDETLYLLNTSTRQWSRALPAGPRPAGRYGHSLNILGSKIYIFGGQVEGYFMNDLAAFDLNQLQMPNNKWELLMQGEASAKIPAARTNHSMVTYNDKMFLFGGTNGFQWFNDVWCYDPSVNKWMQLDCIGYIPSPREGHSAALVDDVMYIFGGRTEDGTDLGDLAAFRISTRRWYTFQNMGPSPSPRSGHSMTAVGKSIVVLGGEPSSAATTLNDLGILYVLDTTKIRYPTDAQAAQQSAGRITQGGRRPSVTEAAAPGRKAPSRDGSNGPTESRKASGSISNGALNGYQSPPLYGENGGPNNPNGVGSKLPRAAMAAGPPGPPPQGPTPAKPTTDVSGVGRVRGPSSERGGVPASPQADAVQSPSNREPVKSAEVAPDQGPPTQQLARSGSKKDSVAADVPRSKQTRNRRSQGSVDSSIEPILKAPARPASPPPPTRQPSNPLSRRSSGRNSQTVALLKELDSARNRNAWYASELELARKAGYAPNASFNAALEGNDAESFDDDDRPLIEALIAMRSELANVQSAVDKQAVIAARQIAEAEKQRDAAIQEAVYAKAKLAARSESRALPETEREDMSKKLASALHLQSDLQAQIDSLKSQLDSEKKARHLADDTSNAAQKRMASLEAYKQQTSTEVESLKAELHLAQREAREHSVSGAEAAASLELLKAEKEEFTNKYNESIQASKDHGDTLDSLKAAVAASQDARSHLESKLGEERSQREKAESKLSKLKAEHDARTAELVAATQRLRDAEELADKHATEARTHRQAVLSGLDKLSVREIAKTGGDDGERAVALQKQVTSANALVKKYQQEADAAADKLRSAEERIAGLEQYQEQSSREGVTIRRQLQSALRDTQGLQANNTDLKNKLAAQQLETNAMSVQHNALKNILSERGISPTSAGRSRGLASPRIGSPEQNRLRELESQLVSANAAHEETKQAFAVQVQESETTYREKLSQLESDYQSAVHYVKGTEKMLKQLKDQLSRYKTENTRLQSEVEELEDRLQEGGERGTSRDWETERDTLHKKITELEAELRDSGSQLQKSLESLRVELKESERQRGDAEKSGKEASDALNAKRNDIDQLQSENLLLEQRAHDAEEKVALLLDQVEHSVDSYRRQSRQLPNMAIDPPPGTNGASFGHARNVSSETGSVYEGNGLDARNSAALDNLASELETLRSHWQANSKNYRLSTNFDFDATPVGKKDDHSSGAAAAPAAGPGLSESLADWRKKLDTDEEPLGEAGRRNLHLHHG